MKEVKSSTMQVEEITDLKASKGKEEETGDLR